MKEFFKKKLEEAYPKYSDFEEKQRFNERIDKTMLARATYIPFFKKISEDISSCIPKDWEYGKDYKVEWEYSDLEFSEDGKFELTAKLKINSKKKRA